MDFKMKLCFILVLLLAVFDESDGLHLNKRFRKQSQFHLICDNNYMTAVFNRAYLPMDVNVSDLHLLDAKCKPQWNGENVVVQTPLTECGTLYWKSDQKLFFRNILSDQGYYHNNGVITRKKFFTANLTCTYPRKSTVGDISFNPENGTHFISLSGQGNFSLTMEVFKNSSYREPYRPQDYPVHKQLKEDLYIQYSINTNDSNLVVRAETCRATPTNKPYDDSPQYIFIDHGCDKDETIKHYTFGRKRVQRFSIQAFRFLSDHKYVYLHCDLVVCNKFDENSICAHATKCSRHARSVDKRSGSYDVSGIFPMSLGPVVETKESASEKSSDGESAPWN